MLPAVLRGALDRVARMSSPAVCATLATHASLLRGEAGAVSAACRPVEISAPMTGRYVCGADAKPAAPSRAHVPPETSVASGPVATRLPLEHARTYACWPRSGDVLGCGVTGAPRRGFAIQTFPGRPAGKGQRAQNDAGVDPSKYDLMAVDKGVVQVNGYADDGFVVTNVHVDGGILCCGTLWMMWGCKKMQDVTPESLSMILLLKPAPELLVVGCGKGQVPLPPDVKAWLDSYGIAVELHDTRNAVAYFNLLNQESRSVACALLPGAA